MSKTIWILILAVVLGGGYFILKGASTPDEVVQPIAMVEETKKDEPEDAMMEKAETEDSMMEDEEGIAMMEGEEAVVFEIDGGAYYFDADELTVTEGDTVKIVFNNVGGTHDWVLDEFDARTEVIKTGETDEVTFVASKAGVYEFYCSVGDHRAQGMVGQLIVEPGLE